MHKNRYITLMGLLLALTIALSAAENSIPIPLPLGVKLGLSSIPIMFSLIKINAKSALFLCVLKSCFVLLTRGPTAFFMSMSGGLLSLAVMLVIYKKLNPSVVLLSVSGGIFHNLGQLIAASILMKSAYTLYYAPLLIIAGCIAGILTGICLNAVIPVISKIYCGGNE